MRIGVIADVHGNLLALRAVLAKLKTLSCDRIVNLGACLSGPLQAAETADLLIAEDFLTVRGNHDRQLIDRPVDEMGPSDQAAFGQLTEAHLNWLRAMPVEARIGNIYLCHATPRKDSAYLLETVMPETGDVRLATTDEIRTRLLGVPEDVSVVLHGHTHIPRLMSLDGRLLINPGAVGLPAYDATSTALHYMETGSPHARFAVVTRSGTSDHNWEVQFHAIEYEWDAASEIATAGERGDWARALATGYALRTGS